jgi:hypothetical protein
VLNLRQVSGNSGSSAGHDTAYMSIISFNVHNLMGNIGESLQFGIDDLEEELTGQNDPAPPPESDIMA